MLLTTTEAAQHLNVSESRIRQLIAAGDVEAVKVGGRWLVQDFSLDSYAQRAKNGRPSKAEAAVRASAAPQNFTFMSRNHEVARVTYSPADIRFTKLEVLDWDRVPLALKAYTVQGGGLGEFNRWWGSRAIPEERPDMMFRFLELELSSTFQIPFANMGLSMSDHYWLRPEGLDVRWESLNYYRNAFDMGPVGTSDSMSEWLTAVGLNSPDNTTDGMLSKRWVRDEAGGKVLIKASSPGGREAINEVIATRLYRRLLEPGLYVEYRLARWHGKLVSVCESFLTEEEEFIPAWYVRNLKKKPNNWSEYRLYTQLCADLRVLDAVGYLDRMIVCDSILANTDRHWGNFGIIRNVETLKLRPAPIFDSGNSLWTGRTGQDFAHGTYRFAAKPFYPDAQRQLELVLDGRWYHPEALDGFTDEVRGIFEECGVDEQTATGVCRGIEQRIDAANAWWKATPTYDLPGEWAHPDNLVEWLWLP